MITTLWGRGVLMHRAVKLRPELQKHEDVRSVSCLSLSVSGLILCLSLWVDCPKEWFLIVIRQKTKVEQQNETTTEFYLTQMHTEFNEYLVQSVAPERFSASKDSKNNYMQIKIVTRWHDHNHIMHALKVNSRTNKVNSKLV